MASTFSYNLGKEVENLRWTDYVYIYEKYNDTLLIYNFGKLKFIVLNKAKFLLSIALRKVAKSNS
jgi:hypothetical protein